VRDVEPHTLVYTGRRWYLLAWATDRRDWRTLRTDRLRPLPPTGPRFVPRDPTSGEITQVDDTTCELITGTDSLHDVATYLSKFNVPFTVLEPPELRDLAARYTAAAGGDSSPHTPADGARP
jgi:predicted DNA-binding transcriptional regulator YafY